MNKSEKNDMFTNNGVRLVPRISEIIGVSVNGKTVCYKDAPVTLKQKLNLDIRTMISKIYSRIFN